MVAKAVTLAWLATGTAFAQPVDDSIPPGPRDADTFRIERDGTIAPPTSAPTPAPVPAPIPAPVPTPVPTPALEPAPVVAPPAPTAAPTTTVAPARPVPRRTQPPRAGSTPLSPPAAVPGPEAPLPEPSIAPTDGTIATPTPDPSQTATAPAEAPPVAEDAAEDGDSSRTLWIAAIAAGVLALLGLLYFRRRRSREAVYEESEDFAEQDYVPDTEPQIMPFENPVTEVDPVVPIAPSPVVAAPVVAAPPSNARPRLDLVFTPAAASATDEQATVDFALTVTNAGDAAARNVRMEARLFAMGDDHDAVLTRFFADPLARPVSVAESLVPGVGIDLRAKVTLPRSAVRPIQVADRTLFVPLVAFNLLYDWGADGDTQKGQTAMSYVVGRETRPPAAKMAPFRLDQGPRVYRQVGQRAHQLKRVA